MRRVCGTERRGSKYARAVVSHGAMEEATIVCKDLLSYLQDLPSAVLTDLYGYSSACLAVFR